MEKKKFNFKKFGLVLCVCFITLFAFIPFANFSSIDNVYASSITPSYSVDINCRDTVTSSYSFKSSDLYNIDVFFGAGQPSQYFPCLFSSDIIYSNNTLTVYPNFTYLVVNGTQHYYHDCYLINNAVINENLTISRGSSFIMYFHTDPYLYNRGEYFIVDGYCSDNFNANVYKVTLELKDTAYSINYSPHKYLHITYYDRNNEYLSFVFVVSPDYVFNTRTYFLTNDFTGDEMFDQGYQNGYDAGLSDGSSSGYNDGFNAGQVVGFENGYNSGINDSNQYSFYNLFGAVLDAPVKTFTGLFNFDLLGVNLLGLITGLITLAFVILIIKLCLGGK